MPNALQVALSARPSLLNAWPRTASSIFPATTGTSSTGQTYSAGYSRTARSSSIR